MVGNRSLIFSPNLRCLWCKRCKLDQGIINFDMFGMKGPPKIEHCRVIGNMSIWGLICNKKTPKKYPRSGFFFPPRSQRSPVSKHVGIIDEVVAPLSYRILWPLWIWTGKPSQTHWDLLFEYDENGLLGNANCFQLYHFCVRFRRNIFKLAYILHNTQGLRDSM